MTHNFFLNLMTVLFPVLSLILTFVPDDFNHYINVIARWFYRRFNVAEEKRHQFELHPAALRIFGIVGLLFSVAMVSLMFYHPAS